MPITHDSSGISITDYGATRFEAPLWALDPVPVLRLGTAGTRTGTDLYRVVGIVRLPDGGTAVANRGSNEILWFDAGGAYTHSAGGAGDGPGEFRGLGALARVPPDSVLAYDAGLRRFQVFDADGAFARGFVMSGPGDGPTYPGLLAVTSTGNLLVRDLRGPTPAEQRVGVETFDVRLHDSSGQFVAAIASAPAWQTFSPEPIDGIGFSPVAIPWTVKTLLAVAGDELVLADAATAEIRALDLEGRVRRIFRAPAGMRVAVAPGEIDAFVEEAVAGTPPPVEIRLRVAYGAMPIPPTKPALRSLHAADDGGFWIVGWPASPGEPKPALVIDEHWRLVGALQVPHAFEIHAVLRDHVLGLWTDDLGVEEVREYRVTRDAGDR